MQYLDLAGVQSLWAAIKAETAKATTTVEGENASGTNAYVSVVGTAVDGEGQDGHVNYVVTLHNAASNNDLTTAINALKGDASATGDTLGELEDRIESLETGASVTITESAGSGDVLKSYTFEQNGNEIGVVNIPKDFLVKSGQVREATAADTGFDVGDKILDFTVNSKDGQGQESHILIAVSDLVDVYTGSNGVAVDGSNNITAVVDSAANGNEFLSVSATGLKVSGVSNAINTAKSEVIGTTSDTAADDTVKGAKAYADEAVAAVAGNYATAAQGDRADTALQSVSHGIDGSYVTTTIGAKADNNQTIGVAVATANVSTSGTTDGLAVASDVKTYVDTAVSSKNVSASGDTGANALVEASASNNAVSVNSTTKLQNAVASAESAIQGVQVNSADLTPDANKKVNVTIAEGTTNGTLAVNGTDVAVHGLGSAAYTPATDYATAAQGAAAASALQSISNGTDGDYIDITVTPKGAGTTQEVSGTVTVQPVASASSSAMGLAEASDVKSYVDGKIATLDADLDASGTAAAGGIFVMSGVTEVDGVITSIDSREVEQAGAAAAAESRLRGATDAAGYVANDTLAALRNEINSITGGSGSIATQIQNAVEALDSNVDVNLSGNTVPVYTAQENTAYVLTAVGEVDGLLDQATSKKVLIEPIPASELTRILV